jgi:hypothetical protein
MNMATLSDGAETWLAYYRENNLLHLTLSRRCQILRGEGDTVAPVYDERGRARSSTPRFL